MERGNIFLWYDIPTIEYKKYKAFMILYTGVLNIIIEIFKNVYLIFLCLILYTYFLYLIFLFLQNEIKEEFLIYNKLTE